MKILPVSALLAILSSTMTLTLFFGINSDVQLLWASWILMIAAVICFAIEQQTRTICNCVMKGQIFIEVVKRHRELEKEKLTGLPSVSSGAPMPKVEPPKES